MTAPLLQIENLAISFVDRDRATTPVRAASLSVQAGEMVALVGESGSGKSLTALSVLKLLPSHAQLAGSIRFAGEELINAPETRLRTLRGSRVSMIFQEPMTSLNPLHTIEKQIAEVLLVHQGLDRDRARRRVLELLELVGIPEPAKRLGAYPHELSGGQRQRVMIAMALANEPELLIADEPTTALDVTLQDQILTLLRELQQKLQLAVLLITHDLTLVRRFADSVVVMQNGETVETNRTDALFHAPQHAYTRQLLAAEPAGAPIPVPGDAEVLLDVDNLRVWFPIKRGLLRRTVDHIRAVDGISLQLRRGETIGIVGESGSGKSTLALAILRLLSSEGPIVFMGQRLDLLHRRELKPIRRHLQVVFQDPYGSLSPRMSIQDIIGEGLEVQGMPSEERESRVIKGMTAVGLDPALRHRYPHEFSGGQRQRIAIARALVLEPRLIVLDEPTSALDRTVQVQVVDLLRRLQGEFGFACLFISHDFRVVRALSHRILVMRQGKVIEENETPALLNAPREDYTRRLLAAAFPDGLEATFATAAS